MAETKEMKTLTIGSNTYEIVDESARTSIGDVDTLNTESKELVGAINELSGQITSMTTEINEVAELVGGDA